MYVCDGKSTKKDKNGNEALTYNNTKLLKENEVNISHEKFINLGSIVYGESSFPYLKKDDEILKFEMFSLASVNHNYKETAFGENSTAAKDFRKKLSRREMIRRCKLQYLELLIATGSFKNKKNNLQEMNLNVKYFDANIYYKRTYYYQNKIISKIKTVIKHSISSDNVLDSYSKISLK